MTFMRGVTAPLMIVAMTLLSSCGGGGGGGGGESIPTYTVGGAVSGLAGGGLVLQNNGGNNLAISGNGVFKFSSAIASGSPFAVTVLTHPTSLSQTCTVTNGTGTVGTGNVTSVSVTCVTNTYTVGGNLSGLGSGQSITLQDNGTDNLTLSASGSFTFATPVADGAAYNVTAFSQPSGQTCTVADGSGTVGGANVTNVVVGCVPAAPSPTLGYGIKQLQFSWPAVAGATHYRLFENPDGAMGYVQVGGDITTTSVNHDITLYHRLNASYIVSACDGAGCADSPPISLAANLVPAIGYVKASNTEFGDQFGLALALSGDGNTLAVGAYGEDGAATSIDGDQADNSAIQSGAVYVFTRASANWSQQAYVKASNAGANDQFGIALALSADGNTLAVGAFRESSAATGIGGDQADNTADQSGAVYVFTRSGANWSQQAYVKASNAGAFDKFGYALALSADGNTLAVGAYGESSATSGIGGNQDDNTANHSGAVYVFTRGGTTWSQQAYVKASNTEAIDHFGFTLALSGDGDTLAVGAWGESSAATGIDGDQADDSAVQSGAVYLFTRSGATWSQQAYVKASNTGASDQFGFALALSSDGDTLAVGANGESSAATGIGGDQADDSAPFSGAIYIFARTGTAWSQQAYVKASNAGVSDEFGFPVALSSDGNTLAVGAYSEDSAAFGIGGNQTDNSSLQSGAVYVFARSGATWSQQAYVKASNTGGDFFGSALTLSADGSTLAAGAYGEASAATGIGGNQADNSAVSSGAVYLY